MSFTPPVTRYVLNLPEVRNSTKFFILNLIEVKLPGLPASQQGINHNRLKKCGKLTAWPVLRSDVLQYPSQQTVMTGLFLCDHSDCFDVQRYVFGM